MGEGPLTNARQQGVAIALSTPNEGVSNNLQMFVLVGAAVERVVQ